MHEYLQMYDHEHTQACRIMTDARYNKNKNKNIKYVVFSFVDAWRTQAITITYKNKIV